MREYMIIACDFDGTLCEDKFPDIGKANIKLIEKLIERRKRGDKLILWTCRCGDALEKAIEWCKEFGLEFDAVNSHIQEMVDLYKNDCRKVFADIYIDDKSINLQGVERTRQMEEQIGLAHI